MCEALRAGRILVDEFGEVKSKDTHSEKENIIVKVTGEWARVVAIRRLFGYISVPTKL